MTDINKNKNGKYLSGILLIYIVIVSVLLLVFTGVMLYKAIGPHSDEYRALGETFYRPKKLILPPKRGTIYSNNGTPLSITAPYYIMRFDFKHQALNKVSKDSLNKELRKLADLLYKKLNTPRRPIDKNVLLRRWKDGIAKKSRSTPVLSFKISYLDYVDMLDEDPFRPKISKNGKHKVRSIISKILSKDDEFERIKPFGSLARRTIGDIENTTTPEGITIGSKGIEKGYDAQLAGEVGLAENRYIAGKYSKFVIKPPVNGADVYTTLDMEKQSILESAMRQEMSKINAESGSAILMEVKTGKILAISNLKQSSTGGYYEDRNYAVSDLTEPGSTFKVASMLVALDEDKISPNDTIDVGNGLWRVADRTVRDHNYDKGGYGRISASQAIEFSSNIGLSKIITKAYGNNPSHFVDKILGLGFGLDLGLKIPGYAKAQIRKPNKKNWYSTTLAWMSFGYETQIPPIYTLAFYNAIANNGKYMRPYFVDSVVQNNKKIQENKPEVMIPSIAKPEALSEIKDMLKKVVENGTGKKLRNELVNISGKSGTAQIAQGGRYRGTNGTMYQVSFCAFFPSEDPIYSCIVVMRNPRIGHAGGGSMAGPVIRDVAIAIYSRKKTYPLDSVSKQFNGKKSLSTIYACDDKLYPLLDSLKIKYPTSEHSKVNGNIIKLDFDTENKPLAERYKFTRGIVPNVIGMTASDAIKTIVKCGYIPRLSGYGWVSSQSFSAGQKVPEGKVITIILN